MTVIAVRVEMTSAERVRIDGDAFEVGGNGQLFVYKGEEVVARFQQWVYAVKLDESAAISTTEPLAPEPQMPKGATWVPPPNYKPLTIKPAQLSESGTSFSGPTHTPGAGVPPAGGTAAPVS